MVRRRQQAFALALLAGCGAGAPGSTASAIINGSADSGLDLAVNLISFQDAQDRSFGWCTGSFITPRVVLTAAHCAGGFSGEDHYDVWLADSYDRSTEAFTGLRDPMPYRSVKAAVDPDFNPNDITKGHDVGLILVDRALPAATPPLPLYPLRLDAEDVGAPVRFIGFGIRQEDTGSPLLEKLKASAPLGYVSDQTMGWHDSPYHTCQGDSGGPNLMQVAGIEYIAAVTSYGTSCLTDSNQQRVDTARGFIASFIAANDPQPAPSCSADGFCDLGCPGGDPDCPCGADGRCAATCTDPDRDPDCPLGCSADGTCVRAGCPTPDPDCGDKATGEACASSNECASGFCVLTGPTRICVPPCDAGGGCPSGFSCAQPSNICLMGGGGGCACAAGPGGAGAGGWLAVTATLLAGRRRLRRG